MADIDLSAKFEQISDALMVPISREIQIVRLVRHDTIATVMLSPKTTAPVHGGATISCWRDRREPPSLRSYHD